MAITTAYLSELSELATWLSENATSFFSRVETEGTNTWSAWDNEGNKVLQFSTSFVKAFRLDGSAGVSTGGNITSIGYYGTNIIACDNGIIIDTSGYNSDGSGQRVTFGILITKTNNGKVAIIFSSGERAMRSTNYLYLNLRHVAIGDTTATSTTTTFTPESALQSVLIPFITNAKFGDVSYTPDAFYMPVHSAYGVGISKFVLGGDIFITNGYWAVRDSAPSS